MLTEIERLQLALQATEGLATGDAYGNHHGKNQRKRQASMWQYTDDTLMALSILENLRVYGAINQDALAGSFANHRDGHRGYGRGVTRLLKAISYGGHWHDLSYGMFDGSGSYGNGAAMRVAPIGAYFADDLERVIEQARLSAEVTHSHNEGIAGAVAVAVATAIACQHALTRKTLNFVDFIAQVIDLTPDSEIREKLYLAQTFGENALPKQVADALGNGRPSIAQLTVPFAIWSAAKHAYSYEIAIRQTASVQGDVDTNCAIVGGIVVMYTNIDHIPLSWRNRREALLEWAVL